MLLNAPIVADRKLGGVDKRHASTAAQAGVQVDTQRHERGGKEFHEARVADQSWEFTAQVNAGMLGIKGFEAAIVRLMKQDQDGHDFRKREFSSAIASLGATHETVRMPAWFKGTAKVIDMAEE